MERHGANRRLGVTLNHLAAATDARPADLKGTPPKGPGPAPEVFALELPGAWDVALSREEIAHFKEHGWIVKKRLIDPSELAPIRDCIWPAAVELDAEAAYAAATLGIIENLRGGATTIIDHQYVHVALN